MSKVTFNNTNKAFHSSLKISVENYFKTHKIKKTGNWKLYLKTAVLIPLAVALYLFLLLATYPAIIGVVLCALLGLALTSIAFNVMHDACHGAYSSRKWVNDVMSFTMNALGSNAYIWKIKHNIIHHTYTNIDGIDDDIDNSPFLRQCASQKWRPAHRFQHIYMFFLYAVSTLSWMLFSDFAKYFRKRINTTPINKIPVKEHIIFWLSKALYIFFYGLLPVYFVGWENWLIGFLLIHVIMGVSLSIVFQLAHVVEITAFDEATAAPKQIETEWALHEVLTTADFAPKNKVISWLLGGLNFQVEHHLFPRISHVHYPAISRIIKEQCEHFQLPYHYYPKMTQAIASHVRVMRRLGQKD